MPARSPHQRRPRRLDSWDRHGEHTDTAASSWSHWNASHRHRYTLGVEEETMLLDRGGSLTEYSDRVLSRLSAPLAAHASSETHAGVLELTTGIHRTVSTARAELAALRSKLADELRAMDVAVASAGMHPAARPAFPRLTTGGRYSVIAGSMRSLVRRAPTMALHVHVGVPDPEDAVRLLNGLRRRAPALLALSANSPFCHAGESGFASHRTTVFQGFPRTGLPRPFVDYSDYVEAVDPLLTSGALPDPTYLWWDLRLQPSLGTVEVRLMDAQTSLTETAPLVALIQSLARLELEDEPNDGEVAPEVLAENRFLAARDGLRARLIDRDRGRLVPVRQEIDRLVARCRPHAAALDCSSELEWIDTLATANGADRQRGWLGPNGDLAPVIAALVERFTGARAAGDEQPVAPTPGMAPTEA